MAGERERHHYATGLTCRAYFFFFQKLGEENGNEGGEGETEASPKGFSTRVQRRAVT